MINNVIYGLGTIGFLFLCVLTFGALMIVLLGIFSGMMDSLKEFLKSRKKDDV